MLDLLTKSVIRKKIILMFFYNQSKEFYLREIARLVGTSSGTAKRELDRLLNNDLLLFTKRGNMVFYKLNLKNQFLHNLEEIIKKTIGIEIILKETFSNIKDVDFAFIFGSYAKGGFKSDSDIDLYVVGKINVENLHSIVQKAEKIIHRSINYHLCSILEFKKNLDNDFFHQEIIKKYILLTNNKDEFRAIVE